MQVLTVLNKKGSKLTSKLINCTYFLDAFSMNLGARTVVHPKTRIIAEAGPIVLTFPNG